MINEFLLIPYDDDYQIFFFISDFIDEFLYFTDMITLYVTFPYLFIFLSNKN